MTKRDPCGIYRLILMCASSIGLVTALASLPVTENHRQHTAAGWRHLSYPAVQLLAPDWLSGWDCLHSATEPDPVFVPDPGSLERVCQPEDFPAFQEFGVLLFGILSEDSGEVFCLYDSARRRWIRLASGQTDPVSKIRIHGALHDEVIEDLATGDLFRIDRDRYRLVLLKQQGETCKP